MEERFAQQLKKGVLELLVLEMICREEAYGYVLLSRLKEQSGSQFVLKEGTLYPILYRLEDEGLISSGWSHGSGRSAPKKIYRATEKGLTENRRRWTLWRQFAATVSSFDHQGGEHT